MRLAFTPRALAVAVVLSLTALVAYEVCRIPVQVSDSLGNLLQVQRQTVGDVFVSQFSNGAYVRPLLWTQIKLAYEGAQGRETIAFKAIHVAQLLLLALLVLRLMRVRSREECVAAVLATLVLFGLHTFDGLVREAFPINSFLTVALCVLAVLVLADGETAVWWRDAAAVGIFAAATLTLESGILVAVAVVGARLAGMRGVSVRGTVVVALALAAYVFVRFALVGAGAPSLSERPSGFGFRVLEPDQLVTQFGSNPLPFYLYNVAASLVTVLLAEPRGGVWYAMQGVVTGGGWPAWLWINVTASVVATALVLWAGLITFARWRAAGLGRQERLMLIAIAVLTANAAVSFGYTKDVIMSTGGIAFALAVYAATIILLTRAHPAPRTVYAVVALGIALWSLRAVALPVRLEMQAARVRQEWRDVDEWLERQHIAVATPEARALVTRLRRSALRTRPRPVEWTGWRALLDLN